MKTIIAAIQGVSPYSQSRPYAVEKQQGEGYEDFERRTWRERLHVDASGVVFIPPMAYKNALAETAKFLSMPIPGKGKSTFTKHFEAGVLCTQLASLRIRVEDVKCERLFLPADGVRGSGKRVFKYYPRIEEGWTTEFTFVILDETVLQTMPGEKDRTVFQHMLEECGKFIGIGRFRPRNNGYYGRFKVTELLITDA